MPRPLPTVGVGLARGRIRSLHRTHEDHGADEEGRYHQHEPVQPAAAAPRLRPLVRLELGTNVGGQLASLVVLRDAEEWCGHEALCWKAATVTTLAYLTCSP